MAFAMGTQLLDGCVLAVLSRGDAYGYVLTQQVKERLDISESTLYPVLRRRNRRYYAITPPGQGYLTQLRGEWVRFRDGVDWILKEDGHGQDHLFG